MLTLHKLVADGDQATAKIANYFFERDTAEYYSPDESVASRWIGGGAGDFDLTAGQPVDVKQFQNLLAGYDPAGNIFTTRPPEERHVAGLDMTFSVVKSRSILRASGDDEIRVALDENLFKAVERTIRYAEELGYFVQRTGKGGRVKTGAMTTVAAFLHHTSRDGDMQDHIHAAVLNAAWNLKEDRNPGGRLDFESVYHGCRELGAVFRAELAKLDMDLGFQIERKGRFFEYVGVQAAAIAHFSKGMRRIRDAVGAHASAKSKEISALNSRAEKIYETPEIRDHIHRTELQTKFGIDSITVELARTSSTAIPEYLQPRFDLDEVVDSLGNAYPYFRVEDIRREIAVAAAGVFGAAEIQKLAAAALESPRLLKIAVPHHTAPPESGQLETVSLERFTTRENYSADRRVATWIARSSECRNHALPVADVKRAISVFEAEMGFSLSVEQRQAVFDMTARGNTAPVEGVAGAGKTTVLAVPVQLYQAAGFRVIAVSQKNVIATGLGRTLGCESMTLAKFVLDTLGPPGEEVGRKLRLDSRTVIVLDEAGEVGGLAYERLRQVIEPIGAKFIPLGHGRQTQAINGTQGWSIVVDNAKFVTQLRETRRQVDPEYGRELTALSEGKAIPALERLARDGKLIVAGGDGLITVLNKFKVDIEKHGLENSFVLTHTNLAARRVNEAIRMELRARCVLGQHDFAVNVTAPDGSGVYQTSVAVGDRVIIRGKHKNLVKNGEVFIITAIIQKDEGRLEIEMKRPMWKRKTIRIDTADFDRFHHSYAITSTISQGQEKQGVTYWIESGSMAHLVSFYLSLSRGKQAANVVVSGYAAQDLAVLQGRDLVDLTPSETAHVILDAVRDESKLRKTTMKAELLTKCSGTVAERFQYDNQLHEQLRRREYVKMRREQCQEDMDRTAREAERLARLVGQPSKIIVDDAAPVSADGRLDRRQELTIEERKHRAEELRTGASMAEEIAKAARGESIHDQRNVKKALEVAERKAMRAVESVERRLLNLISGKILPANKRINAARTKVKEARQIYAARLPMGSKQREQFVERCQEVDQYYRERAEIVRDWRAQELENLPSLGEMERSLRSDYQAKLADRRREATLSRRQHFAAVEAAEAAWRYAPANAMAGELKQLAAARDRARYAYAAELTQSGRTKFAIRNAAIDRAVGIEHAEALQEQRSLFSHAPETEVRNVSSGANLQLRMRGRRI